MARAFVKEDSPQAEIRPNTQELDAAMEDELFGETLGGPKNFITPKGLANLQSELESFSKNPQAEGAQRKIHVLQRRIQLAEVIDPEKQSGDQVLFGATVTVVDENEETRIYRIVGIDETDLSTGKISWASPIGKALLQAQVGDVVTIDRPHGSEELEILKIEYKQI